VEGIAKTITMVTVLKEESITAKYKECSDSVQCTLSGLLPEPR
jgi:hypothetical protein